jgi:hypothetical protein
MKSVLLIAVVMLSLAFWFQVSFGIEVKGGIMEDVVVADSGSTDTTIVTELKQGWEPIGPRSFDVGKDGNIYIFDPLGAKVMQYDKNGRFISSFLVSNMRGEQKPGEDYKDIAVDNWGNCYVIKGSSIAKFSPDGNALYGIPPLVEKYGAVGVEKYVTIGAARSVYWIALTDKSGRLYNYGDEQEGGINIYGRDGSVDSVIDKGDYYYKDIGIVQKEVGDDIFFRVNKYLIKTSLEEYAQGGKRDTVAILPDWIRLRVFADDKVREAGWIEHPYVLIGFDRDNCFYFHQAEDYGMPFICCWSHSIVKFQLEGGKLVKRGEVELCFKRGQDECNDAKELWSFIKRFIVTGDGTIYFLHGTVDKIKVSKITMEENGNSE